MKTPILLLLSFLCIGYFSANAQLSMWQQAGDNIYNDNLRGNVGVGTTTPAERLTVIGNILASGITRSGNTMVGAWPKSGAFAFFGNSTLDQTADKNYALLQLEGNGRTYLNSPEDIRFRINNLDQMILANNGNVGIGTISPGEKLHVSTRIRAGKTSVGNWPVSDAFAFFGNSTLDQTADKNYALLQLEGNGRTYLNSPEDIRFRIGNTDQMILANNGNVGIGTTSPGAKLDVKGNSRISGKLNINNNSDANASAGGALILGALNNHNIGMDNNEIQARFNGAVSTLYLNAEGGNTVLNEFGGNTGIGVTSPKEKLHVSTRIRAGNTSVGNWPLSDAYAFFGNSTLDHTVDKNYALLQLQGNGRTFLNSPEDIRFRIGNSDRMILANNGNVGIGTTSPGAKLDVNGNSRISGRLNLDSGRGSLYLGQGTGTSASSDFTVAIGQNAGKKVTGQANTFVGSEAGLNATSGVQNVAIGLVAGKNMTTGKFNVYVGAFTGASSSASESSKTYVGYNINSLKGTEAENSFAIGNNITVTAKHSGVLGNASIQKVGGFVNWSSVSDERFKKKIKENVKGLDFILQLRPVTYQLDAEKLYHFSKNAPQENKAESRAAADEQLPKIADLDSVMKKALAEKSKITYTGFLAQQVAEAATKTGFDFSGVVKPSNEKDAYGLRYAEFTVPLVKATQEQQAIIEEQKEVIKELSGVYQKQQEQLNEQQIQIDELTSLVEQLIAEKSAEVAKQSLILPIQESFIMAQNKPNPFYENTTIDYFIPSHIQKAALQVTSVEGRILGTVNIEKMGKGQVVIAANTYPVGNYFYSLILDGKIVETKQMILAK